MNPTPQGSSTVLPLVDGKSIALKKHQIRAIFRCASLLLLVAGYSTYNFIVDSKVGDAGTGVNNVSTSTRTQRRLTRDLDAMTPSRTDRADILENFDRNSEQKSPFYLPDEEAFVRLMKRDGIDSTKPSSSPTSSPSNSPSNSPSKSPSNSPSKSPSKSPTNSTSSNSTVASPLGYCEQKREPVDSVQTDNPDESPWYLIPYILIVLYMFIALAVVVDEFFVPALEEMSSDRHLNLSMDVAGATLMAAGGSAPELFTALIGTFAESDVGFGTIVGSAVFNVLFVIAMCSLLSKEVLTLTWWPLFRDCTYYVISLIVLAVFVEFSSKGEIHMIEAAILFVMYLGYVLLMTYNQQLYKKITGKSLIDTVEPEIQVESVIYMSTSNNNAAATAGSNTSLNPRQIRNFRWQGTFRAGILKLLREPSNWVENGGLGIVSQIAGDVDDTWKIVDKDHDGWVSKSELKSLFEELECPLSDAQLDIVLVQLDEDKDGKVNEKEFTNWYIKSEERIRSRIRNVFDSVDDNESGTIDRAEVKNLLLQLEPQVSDTDVQQALDEMYQEGSTEEITYKEFSDWYMKSLLFERQTKQVQNAIGGIEGIFENFKPPEGNGIFPIVCWLIVLPLIVTLSLTVPDVRRPGKGKGYWCYLSFVIAIAWVGLYSYIMVNFAERVGQIVGIPDVVMGLTFLAAGTSVPDLLSSVIVARRGEGDMAVSSSIGSNIFDILVGLPLPWFFYSLIKEQPVCIVANGVVINVVILLVMVVLIIVTIHFSGWKLTKTVAYVMFFLYFAFLTQAVITAMI